MRTIVASLTSNVKGKLVSLLKLTISFIHTLPWVIAGIFGERLVPPLRTKSKAEAQ